MKILVIFTGGTIGSAVSGNWISTDMSANYVLLDRYRSETGDNTTQFDVMTPCTMLSENLSAKELNLIIKSVASNLDKDYDGIIVTHGTDTLQYTVSALYYSFADTKIPVIMVSSDYPLSDIRANGVRNFIEATEYIKAKNKGGVYVAYKNYNEENVAIFKGNCLLSHGEVCGNLYGIECEDIEKGVGAVEYSADTQILTISAIPCDSFNYLLDGIKAVIIRPYHSGTIDTENPSLEKFCKAAYEKNIPVFLTGIMSEKNYDSLKKLDVLKILPIKKMPFPSVFMKCWLGISMEKDIKEFMV